MKKIKLLMIMTIFTLSACQNQNEINPEQTGKFAKSKTLQTNSEDIPEGIKTITLIVSEPSVSINLYMDRAINIVWGDGQQENVSEPEARFHTYTDGITEHVIEIYETGTSTTLIDFGCADSGITSLDISDCSELEILEINQGELTNLDLSQNKKLNWLYCPQMNLETIDLSNNPMLMFFECYENSLTALDVSHNPNLHTISCRNNPFITDTNSLKAFAETLPDRTGKFNGTINLDNTEAANTIKDICAAKNWKVW